MGVDVVPETAARDTRGTLLWPVKGFIVAAMAPADFFVPVTCIQRYIIEQDEESNADLANSRHITLESHRKHTNTLHHIPVLPNRSDK